MSRLMKVAVILVLIVVLLGVACLPGTGILQRDRSSAQGMELVREVWEVILGDYVDRNDIDADVLSEGAIRGLVEALEDPYTAYLGPEQHQLQRTQLEGEFSGIGATITIREGHLTVVSAMPGSPAEAAGIRPGDMILEVDGDAVSAMTLTEATLRIRGKRGTTVRLLVLGEGEQVPREIEVIRAELKLPSVSWNMLPDGVAHIKITNFSDRTDTELSSVLQEVQSREAAGIVLDLRDNPGGILEAAVNVAGQFLSGGLVVYVVDGRGERTDWEAGQEGLALDAPLVVLVNGGSASASEVVAGALQDTARGVIVGVGTVGKGSANHVHELSNGGALYITYARWYTPDGRQIDHKGIVPDLIVERTAQDIGENRDPQLDRAIELLREQFPRGSS